MRDQVLIILNEREPTKLKAAETLQQLLCEENITASRVAITPTLTDTLKARRPTVVVLDYLLGDVTTGLDLLAGFQKLPANDQPIAFLLTDEPSVRVAVQAMRNGARNYFELDRPRAVHELCGEIVATLQIIKRIQSRPTRRPRLSLDDFTANSSALRRCIESLRAALVQRERFVVLLGEPGTGRRTLAHGYLSQLNPNGIVREVDGTLLDQPFSNLCPEPSHDLAGTSSAPHQLLLHGIDEALPELVSALSSNSTQKRRSSRVPLEVAATFSTAEEKTAKVLARELAAQVINVPPLAERLDDLPGLLNAFNREACEFLGSKTRSVAGDIVAWCAAEVWPANCAELRGSYIDAVIRATQRDENFLETLRESKRLWAESQSFHQSNLTPERLTIAHTFEESQGDLRLTAARLGCSTAVVREALRTGGMR